MDLAISEPAYLTWLYCLVAQPQPKQADADLLRRPDVMPKSIQDRKPDHWPPTPEHSRAQLRALVERELPPLVALAERLRVEQEEPLRAGVRLRAQTLTSAGGDGLRLLREIALHERAFQRAHDALLRAQRQAARTPVARPCLPFSVRVQSRHCQGFCGESRVFFPTRCFSCAANAVSSLNNEPASR
jgi:hypothetical protein